MTTLLTAFVKKGEDFIIVSEDVPKDEMWYLLARIFDESEEFQDPYRAYASYMKVLKQPTSNYTDFSLRRSNELKKFYNINLTK